jgi:ribosome-associated protein
MAKITDKKAVVKKAATKKSPAKKSAAKKIAVKKTAVKKTPLTEKELEQKEANRIANTEQKKKPGSTARRPKKNATKAQTDNLLDAIVEGMKNKKAKNITVINISALEHRVADYFVICDADSNTHVNAISNEIEETVVKATKEKPFRSEGQQNSEWILIDYVNIVAHVFLRETREYYNIEGLWADGEITNIED